MQGVFQLVLPFQLEFAFDEAEPEASPAHTASPPVVEQPRRRSRRRVARPRATDVGCEQAPDACAV